jgi:O-antigen ligase
MALPVADGSESAVSVNPRAGMAMERATQGFAVVGIVLLSGAVVLPAESWLGSGRNEAGPVFQGMAVAIYGISAFCLAVRLIMGQRLTLPVLPLVFAVLAMASTLWSVNGPITLTKASGLLGSTVFGLFLVNFAASDLPRKILPVASFLVMIASVFLALGLPELAVHQHDVHDGAWKGAFFHKNILGRESAAAAIVFLTIAVFERRALPFAAYLLAVAVCVLSGSRTGWVMTFAASSLVPLMHLYSRERLGAAAVVLSFAPLLLLAGLLVVAQADLLATSFGRDLTFTGRTSLWAEVLHGVAERPLLGYGYRAFWDPDGAATADIAYRLGWFPDHSHSAFVDAAADFGIVGPILFVALLGGTMIRLLSAFLHSPDIGHTWALLFVVNMFILSLSDSVLIIPNNANWPLFMVACLYANRPYPRRNRWAHGATVGRPAAGLR